MKVFQLEVTWSFNSESKAFRSPSLSPKDVFAEAPGSGANVGKVQELVAPHQRLAMLGLGIGEDEVKNGVHVGHFHGSPVLKHATSDGLERIGPGPGFAKLLRLQLVKDGLAFQNATAMTDQVILSCFIVFYCPVYLKTSLSQK